MWILKLSSILKSTCKIIFTHKNVEPKINPKFTQNIVENEALNLQNKYVFPGSGTLMQGWWLYIKSQKTNPWDPAIREMLCNILLIGTCVPHVGRVLRTLATQVMQPLAASPGV